MVTFYSKNQLEVSVDKLILILIALFVPPLAVFMRRGLGGSFWLNIVLWLLGAFPGMVHALYVVATD